ncbi:MAG: ATP-dependent DNA helicase [Chloroflexota bacterium]
MTEEPGTLADRRGAIAALLLADLTADEQVRAVESERRRVLVIAGAGSGKTEVMARRVAWWVGVDGVSKDQIVAFTFTERAAEEMKFRIREWVARITPAGVDATLGSMYVGTIHAYCMRLLRDLDADRFHAFEVLDDIGRIALIQRRYHSVLGLPSLQGAAGLGMFATIDLFLRGYDLLNEYGELDVELRAGPVPHRLEDEEEWCRAATLRTDVGTAPVARAFATSVARFYALLQCRRFLDFSTSQMEAVRLCEDPAALQRLRAAVSHVVVDEIQDLNPIQDRLVRRMVGDAGRLTAVGDHRQAIFNWRGGRVELMAALHAELEADPDGEVVELTQNFRSTPPIIEISNLWSNTIQAPGTLPNPAMRHGRPSRMDESSSHVGAARFTTREDEAAWIAETVSRLVTADGQGARNDTSDGARGLTFADIAVLCRSATDARTYMRALRARDVPVVFRAGPDLFSQPEVLLFLAGTALMAGIDQFVGLPSDPRTLPGRINAVLGCGPDSRDVISAACAALRAEGLSLAEDVEERLQIAATEVAARIQDSPPDPTAQARLRSGRLRTWLAGRRPLRRVFPQAIFHFLLEEAGIDAWDTQQPREAAAMFHVGQLSRLVTGIETPGWTRPAEFRFQVIALALWGTQGARSEEAPLLAAPEAVTISTIHAAKGLEFSAVFLADVCARRFPSSRAGTPPQLPYDGPMLTRINPANLADNANRDAERRLLYVAVTRAERYLFVSASGTQQSSFLAQLVPLMAGAGATTVGTPAGLAGALTMIASEARRDSRLVTSFSDLRYFLECSHDFYLRKVLGFAPSIDQAFGYGRGVHNVLRAIHTDPRRWAELALDRAALETEVRQLVESGLFYLRHTTGQPADNMRNRAVEVVADYVELYADELSRLEFEPEREFEALLEEEKALVTGAIDLVRLDDPPRVTIVDFKSGEPGSDAHSLDEEEMRLQVTMYGLAAKHELEYEPDQGFVRYLGGVDDQGRRELDVDLSAEAMADARSTVSHTVAAIRDREFFHGPAPERQLARCTRCDFLPFCGLPEARATRGGT